MASRGLPGVEDDPRLDDSNLRPHPFGLRRPGRYAPQKRGRLEQVYENFRFMNIAVSVVLVECGGAIFSLAHKFGFRCCHRVFRTDTEP